MRVGPSATTPVSIAPVCPFPVAVLNLPAVAYGRPVPQETKNANVVVASTHDNPPQAEKPRLCYQ